MSSNQLDSLASFTFPSMGHLRLIDLGYNQLTRISTATFTNLGKIQKSNMYLPINWRISIINKNAINIRSSHHHNLESLKHCFFILTSNEQINNEKMKLLEKILIKKAKTYWVEKSKFNSKFFHSHD